MNEDMEDLLNGSATINDIRKKSILPPLESREANALYAKTLPNSVYVRYRAAEDGKISVALHIDSPACTETYIAQEVQADFIEKLQALFRECSVD